MIGCWIEFLAPIFAWFKKKSVKRLTWITSASVKNGPARQFFCNNLDQKMLRNFLMDWASFRIWPLDRSSHMSDSMIVMCSSILNLGPGIRFDYFSKFCSLLESCQNFPHLSWIFNGRALPCLRPNFFLVAFLRLAGLLAHQRLTAVYCINWDLKLIKNGIFYWNFYF